VGLLINAFAKLTLFFCPEESSPVILSNSSFNLNFSDKYSICSFKFSTLYNLPYTVKFCLTFSFFGTSEK